MKISMDFYPSEPQLETSFKQRNRFFLGPQTKKPFFGHENKGNLKCYISMPSGLSNTCIFLGASKYTPKFGHPSHFKKFIT